MGKEVDVMICVSSNLKAIKDWQEPANGDLNQRKIDGAPGEAHGLHQGRHCNFVTFSQAGIQYEWPVHEVLRICFAGMITVFSVCCFSSPISHQPSPMSQ